MGKNSFWGGEKNTLLQALVSALLVAACKSVFFCALAFTCSSNICSVVSHPLVNTEVFHQPF